MADILILNDGWCGWMVAAGLAAELPSIRHRLFIVDVRPPLQNEVVLTSPRAQSFHDSVGLKPERVLSDAGFSLGMKVVDERLSISGLIPFGTLGRAAGGLGFHHFWHRAAEITQPSPIQDYCFAAASMQANRFAFPRAVNDLKGTYRFGLHIAASLYRDQLREAALLRGVKAVTLNVFEKVGSIEISASATAIGLPEPDLIIDCRRDPDPNEDRGWTWWTDRHLGSKLMRWAAPGSVPEVFSSLHRHENSSLLVAPLRDRTCYCYRYEEYPANDLPGSADGSSYGEAETTSTTGKVGFRNEFWDDKIIRLAASGWSLDPLHWSDHDLLVATIDLLAGSISDKPCKATRNEFNRRVGALCLDKARLALIRNGLVRLPQDDGPANSVDLSSAILSPILLYRRSGHIGAARKEKLDTTEWITTCLVAGLVPQAHHRLAEAVPAEQLINDLRLLREDISDAVEELPPYPSFLSKPAHGGAF